MDGCKPLGTGDTCFEVDLSTHRAAATYPVAGAYTRSRKSSTCATPGHRHELS